MTDRLRASGAFSSAMSVGRSLVKRLTDVVRLGSELAALLGGGRRGARRAARGAAGTGRSARRAARRTGELRERRRRRLRLRLPGQPLREARLRSSPRGFTWVRRSSTDFYPAVRSAVFTSRDPRGGRRLRPLRRARSGSTFCRRSDGRRLKLDSPYDLENQMTVYVATDTRRPAPAGMARARRRAPRGRAPLDGRLGPLALHEPPRDVPGLRDGGLAARARTASRSACRRDPGSVKRLAAGVPRRRAPVAVRDALVLGGLRRARATRCAASSWPSCRSRTRATPCSPS